MLTLTREELYSVTGYKRKAWQIRWFRNRGWVFEIDKDGRAVVSASYANQRLGAAEVSASAWKPDFTKLGRA